MSEVAKHNKDGDAWTVVHGKILDISDFLPRHPGGKAVLKQYAGKVRSSTISSHLQLVLRVVVGQRCDVIECPARGCGAKKIVARTVESCAPALLLDWLSCAVL